MRGNGLVGLQVLGPKTMAEMCAFFPSPLRFYCQIFQKYVCAFQFSSVVQSCMTLCDPMNRSMSGLPVHHQLPDFTQTRVHLVGDAIQPSHPLSFPSPPAPSPAQHQDLFQ